jgi:hypothetical protein
MVRLGFKWGLVGMSSSCAAAGRLVCSVWHCSLWRGLGGTRAGRWYLEEGSSQVGYSYSSS